MPALPIISGAECVAALKVLGYSVVAQKGSHVRLHCEGKGPVTVPLHRELKRRTLRSIVRSVDLTVEDFIALLR